MLSTNPKPKACSHCGTSFTPVRAMQKVCSPICANRLVRKAKVTERATTRARKEAIKTIPQLIKEAQFEFNAFIRTRDMHQPCICCGRTEAMGYGRSAHGWDCGHYRSTGSASHLRFNEDNAHRQLVLCNRHGAGRAVDYRIGLINRIGLARVEALESSNQVHKWTAEELRAIKAEYRSKRKALEEQHEAT